MRKVFCGQYGNGVLCLHREQEQGAGIAHGGSHMKRLQMPQKIALHPHEKKNIPRVK